MNYGIVVTVGLALVILLPIACASKVAPSLTTTETRAVQVTEEPKQIGVSSTEVKSKEGWEAEWDKVLIEAKKEGRVVIYGPPLAEARRGVIEGFQKAYPGIIVEFTGMPGGAQIPKIEAERRAGLYINDIIIAGTSTIILPPVRQFIVSIKPHLILPEVTNAKLWMEERLDFGDNSGEFNLIFTVAALSPVIYNSNLVNANKIKGISYWEFTRPEWKGKIILRDPRVVGSGQALATFWYIHSELGIEYIKSLAANEAILSRDARFIAEMVARGKYSIAMAPDFASAIEMQKAGMPVQWLEDIKEGTHIGSSFGSVSFMDKAPHANAATIFLNWLLGKEGQTIWSRAVGYASRRLDVPIDHVMPQVLPKPEMKNLIRTDKEKIIKMREDIVPQLNKIFAGF